MTEKYHNTIFLVRHGENPANVTGEFSYKRVDYSLTPRGVAQAQQTARYFIDKQIDEIYASPLKRARETANAIAEAVALPVTIMEEFREVNIGELEQMAPNKESWGIHNRIIQEWRSGHLDVAFPGGENYYGLLERLRQGLRKVTAGKTGKNIVIAGHGGIFTHPIKDICPDVDLQEILHVENRNCSITRITLTTAGDRLEGHMQFWASAGHITGDAANFVPGTKFLPALEEEGKAV